MSRRLTPHSLTALTAQREIDEALIEMYEDELYGWGPWLFKQVPGGFGWCWLLLFSALLGCATAEPPALEEPPSGLWVLSTTDKMFLSEDVALWLRPKGTDAYWTRVDPPGVVIGHPTTLERLTFHSWRWGILPLRIPRGGLVLELKRGGSEYREPCSDLHLEYVPSRARAAILEVDWCLPVYPPLVRLGNEDVPRDIMLTR